MVLATNRAACGLLVAAGRERWLASPLPPRPQQALAKPFTVGEAIRYALAYYPATGAFLERVPGARRVWIWRGPAGFLSPWTHRPQERRLLNCRGVSRHSFLNACLHVWSLFR